MKKMLLITILATIALFAKDANKTDNINLQTTDMVYQLELKKYPKFLCEAKLKNGEIQKFVSVKSIMLVYTHQDYFKKHKLLKDSIDKIYVYDYLDGTKVEAKKALYMFGSRTVGPHGDDLIPLKNQANVKLFKLKYGGTKLLPFTKISKGLLKYLDM